MSEKTRLQEIFEENGENVRSYSGRGMYGKRCLGVALTEGACLGGLFASVLGCLNEDDLSDICLLEAFEDMQVDSLGKGSIVYFPRIDFCE